MTTVTEEKKDFGEKEYHQFLWRLFKELQYDRHYGSRRQREYAIDIMERVLKQNEL